MVRCMYKSVVWNTCEEKEEKGEEVVEENNEEEDKMVLEWRLVSQHIKVLEDEFDSNGCPKVKIFYVDMGDFPWSISMCERFGRIFMSIVEWEKRQAAKSNQAAPRLIFVKQDRDFWPGSETDPESVRRSKLKLEQYSRAIPGPDYHTIGVHTWDGPADMKMYHSLFYNSDLAGARFIRDNMHPFDRFELDGCCSAQADDQGQVLLSSSCPLTSNFQMAMDDMITETRASILLRCQIGDDGMIFLRIPGRYSNSFHRAFAPDEIEQMATSGLFLPTRDDRGKEWHLHLSTAGHGLMLGGEWSSLCQENSFDGNTIVSFWHYRATPMILAPYLQVPSLLVTSEQGPPHARCTRCGHVLHPLGSGSA